MNIQMYYRFIPSLKTFPKMFDFMPPKNIFEELRAIFCKNPMQRIENENIKAKIKQSIDQEHLNGNTTILNMFNYN